jgi:hypothetical protein
VVKTAVGFLQEIEDRADFRALRGRNIYQRPDISTHIANLIPKETLAIFQPANAIFVI